MLFSDPKSGLYQNRIDQFTPFPFKNRKKGGFPKVWDGLWL